MIVVTSKTKLPLISVPVHPAGSLLLRVSLLSVSPAGLCLLPDEVTHVVNDGVGLYAGLGHPVQHPLEGGIVAHDVSGQTQSRRANIVNSQLSLSQLYLFATFQGWQLSPCLSSSLTRNC